MPDFRQAGHLPNRRSDEQGHADPGDLPRQRRGTTPQMHGRYPDFDVLEQAEHWDEVTRRAVLDRVENAPPLRFFDEGEATALTVLCDLVTAQDAEPKIPVLAYVDEKLFHGSLDGFRYFDMPDDRETWRRVARGLDQTARERGAGSFALASAQVRLEVCHDFANGDLHGGVWATLNVSRAWSLVLRHILQAFYAHPWAWNEIGFGGPAYPRGYAAFGSPELGEAEHWEGREAFGRDPVRDTKARGLE
jgi:Gluconate 2-dehydrogenase subunit 3